MAVSGRKQTYMLGCIDAGSAEDFDNKCEPCLSEGQHVEAHGYCVQCQEYLCKTCKDCHRKTKVSKNHQILGRDEFDKIKTTKKLNNECTEQCPIHQKEVIKFYCKKHAYLCCNDCITIYHRNCKLDFIPDKCADVADGKEYNRIMIQLSEKLREAEEVCKKAESCSSNTNEKDEEVIKKIEEFRAEINNRLDQMQQDILNSNERKTSNNKEITQKVIGACGNIASEMKKLQSSLRANKSKDQHGQLYIDIKSAESALKSDVLTQATEQLMGMDIQYSFIRSADLERLLSKETVFGEIYDLPQTTKKKNTIDHLTIKNELNVKSKSDKCGCFITGCDVLTSNKLVMADSNNKKVKVLSVEDKLVLQEKVLDSAPVDVAVMSENQFAVTIPDVRRIDVMTTDDKMSRVRSIKVNGTCCGIDCHQDRLYVACLHPSSVVVLTTQGNMLSNIPMNFLTYNVPYIAVRKDANLLYISDNVNNNIDGVPLHGGVTATYKQEDLQGPFGMCLLDDGSMLICSRYNGTIQQVNDDLKEGKMMHKDIDCPRSICYSAHNDEIYVGCNSNNLKVLITKQH